MRPAVDPQTRFWPKVTLSPGCWEWSAGETNGYGRFFDGKKVVLATRWLWELIHGPLEPGAEVAHRCDNPPCVRPTHLFKATHLENVRDMFTKGRAQPPPNMAGHNRLLSDQDVEDIRWLFTGQRGHQTVLAEQYGVSLTTINKIVRGRTRVST